MPGESTEVRICPACGKKNRIKTNAPSGIFRCGSCQTPLTGTPFASWISRIRSTAPELVLRVARGTAAIALLAIPVFAAYVAITEPRQQTTKYPSPSPKPFVGPAKDSLTDEEIRALTANGVARQSAKPTDEEIGALVDYYDARTPKPTATPLSDEEFVKSIGGVKVPFDPSQPFEPVDSKASALLDAIERDKRVKMAKRAEAFSAPEIPMPDNGLKEVFTSNDLIALTKSQDSLVSELKALGLGSKLSNEEQEEFFGKELWEQDATWWRTKVLDKLDFATRERIKTQLVEQDSALRERANRAPFTVKSAPGMNYLVKLSDSITNAPTLTIFVRGGSTVKVKVPLGTYTVKYAAGEKWYGDKNLFGPSTGYSKASDLFTFERNGSKIRGYTITLYKVRDGNLRTEAISPESF